MTADCLYLMAAAQARQVEMHPHNPYAMTLDPQIGADGAAWLKRWQRHGPRILNLDIAPHQQGIAVPAKAERQAADRNHFPGAVVFDDLSWQYGSPFAKAAVSFLKSDNVGIDFAQDRKNAFGVPLAV